MMDKFSKLINRFSDIPDNDEGLSIEQKEKRLEFLQTLTPKELAKLADVILEKNGESLHYLDKYTLLEVNYIFSMFPIEKINKKLNDFIDTAIKHNVCSIIDYRVYNANKLIIADIKKYKKYREKRNKNKNE